VRQSRTTVTARVAALTALTRAFGRAYGADTARRVAGGALTRRIWRAVGGVEADCGCDRHAARPALGMSAVPNCGPIPASETAAEKVGAAPQVASTATLPA
jgi:hypothetical protein